MLARVLRAKVARPAVAPVARTLQLAKFSTAAISAPTEVAAPTEAAAVAPIQDNRGSLAKYGAFPTVAAALTILFSKEFVILNEEWVLAGDVCFFAFVAYCYMGDSINQSVEAIRTKKNKQVKDMYDTGVLVSEMAIDSIKSWNHYPQILKNIKQEHDEVNKLTSEAEYWRIRQSLRNATVAKLNELMATEKREIQAKSQAVTADASAWVRDQFQNNPALRARATEYFINDLVEPQTKISPVGRTFADFFAEQDPELQDKQ